MVNKKELALIALLINVFFMPWLGTLLLKDKRWKTILVLWIIAIPLSFVFIGLFIMFGIWIWGILIAAKAFTKAKGDLFK